MADVDATKAPVQLIDWTAVAQNTIVQTSVHSFTAKLQAGVHIQAFLDTETAHTGTRFIIMVSSAASGDEDWAEYCEFHALVGTANAEPITNNPLVATSTTITCASTTGYTTEGEWRAIKDGTLINSELIYQIAYSATPDITILDGTANEHAQTTPMYNIAFSKTIHIPMEVYRLKVVVDNTVDDDGSTLNYKVRIIDVTGIG